MYMYVLADVKVVISIRYLFLSIGQLSSSEDWIALAGLGFAGLVAIWAASNLISVNTNLLFFVKEG